MLRGSLLTEDFLIEGITDYPEWKALKDKDIASLREQLTAIYSKFPTNGTNVIEATTENDLIEPILNALGWDHHLTQQTTARKGREHDADYILSTFPIIRKQDEAEHGRFLTRDLILAYMRALKAGDTDVKVAA